MGGQGNYNKFFILMTGSITLGYRRIQTPQIIQQRITGGKGKHGRKTHKKTTCPSKKGIPSLYPKAGRHSHRSKMYVSRVAEIS